MLLFEGGCCLAESLGCGPQLVLATPRILREAARTPNRPRHQDAHSPRANALTPKLWAIQAVKFYQREISPKRPATCRFTPTCSHFAVEALERHGLRRGLSLTAGRLFRCRPGARRGLDPVPM
jgi:putative membrane protein insertion efficiency factor